MPGNVIQKLKKIITYLFIKIEKRLAVFITFHGRPKRAEVIGIYSDQLKEYSKIAVVIQGPVVTDEDFTLETIKLYKKIFPKSLIILSTWDTIDRAILEKIKTENIEIVLNHPPAAPGQQHINYQLVSALAGIQHARQKGSDYVLKTRTDQRIYGVSVGEYLVNVINSFPLANAPAQKNRIVGVSLNTFKYRLYGLSDMTMFGHIADMLLYWGAPLDDRAHYQGVYPDDRGFARLKLSLCEVYLATEFLRKVGTEPRWTLEDSWSALAKHFCVIDEQSIDLYWYKYARMREYRYRTYKVIQNDQPLTFAEWLNLYADYKNKIVPPLETITTVIK